LLPSKQEEAVPGVMIPKGRHKENKKNEGIFSDQDWRK
jgi:hypothetical protein